MVPAGLCAYRDLRRKRARKWGDTVTQPDDPRRVGVIVELIDHTIAIAKLNERGDLVQRLTRARQRITDPQVRVVIAGLLKQGKSQLLNSLLNLPAARVGDDEATVVITVVSYSAQPSARLVLAAGPDGTTAAVDIPVDDISTDVRRAPHAGGREVLRVEVGAPSPLLRGGLAFIDTPGVGGLGQPHLSATLGLLPEADAVLVVSDTSQEFTEPEMWFVRQAHWAEIGNDVENAIATAVGDNFVWAYQRSEALADDVARSFADAGLDSVLSAELSPHVMGTDFGRLKALGRMESKPLRRGHKMIIGMRGSYGGVVMIGMLSSVVGLGLFNPLSVGAGLILGRMAYKEDKQNRLLRVRSEAKANVRRFVDDISFVVSKQSRDRLKMIQRLLRDHYREIAEEITRSLTESLQATIAAAQVAETERDNRIRELQRQLGILSQVNDNLAGLEPTLTPRASLGRA